MPLSKKAKRQYELLGGASVLTASALIVSIFLLTSLDQILIRGDQFASVISSVLVDLTNGDRHSNDLSGLTVSPVLEAAAEAKAADMVAKGYFAHTSPEGKDPWYWFEQVGYEYAYAGENLAVDFTDSGDVERAWMNSPLHRDNVLNKNYTEIGIATASGFYQGRPTTFVVQMFGTPKAALQVSDTDTQEIIRDAPRVALDAPTEVPLVLGEASSPVQTHEEVVAQASDAEPLGAIKNAPQEVIVKAARVSSWWERLMAAPRSASHFAYYLLAFFVLVALAIDTGLELRWHHQRKAARAAFLLILIATFFAVGNTLVFSEPTVPATGVSSVAAAASAVR